MIDVALLLQAAAAQRGVFTTAQARTHGFSDDVVERLARTGVCERVVDGVYLALGAPPCWERDLWVAWAAAGPLAAVSGRAAACAQRLPGHRQKLIEVVVPYGLSNRQPVGRLRQTRWLPPEHIVRLSGLPPLTSPARTIFDLAGDPRRRFTFRVEQWRELHKKHIERLISRSLRRDDFTMLAMMRMLAALGRRGRAGTTIIRELVRELGKDYQPTESDLEDVFLDLMRSEGIEEPERQVDISGGHGWLGRADFVFRKRVIWEVDGPHHDEPVQRRQDAERDAEMRAEGYDVHRAHWLALINEPERVLKEVLDSFCQQSPVASPGNC